MAGYAETRDADSAGGDDDHAARIATARPSYDENGKPRCSRAAASIGGAAARTGRTGLAFEARRTSRARVSSGRDRGGRVEGGKLTYYVNGKLVNAASDSSFKDGRIMIQSEGAEIYFRRIELQPLQ